MQFIDQELQNLTLIEIEKLLKKNRKSLKDFPSIPYPQHYVTTHLVNRLIYAKLDYDITELKSQFNNYFKSLTGTIKLLNVQIKDVLIDFFHFKYCFFFSNMMYFI